MRFSTAIVVLAWMAAGSAVAAPLTPEQEFSTKCDLELKFRAKSLPGSIYEDARICPCVLENVKSSVPPEQFQDIADFFSEKYNRISGDDSARYIAKTISHCVGQFYTLEQQAEEANKRMKLLDTLLKGQPKPEAK